MNKEVQDYILETLSFFDPMNKEQIIFDFDLKKLENFNNFNMDQLDSFLKQLIKSKKIKVVIVNRETSYIKTNQSKKSFFKKFINYFLQ